MNKFIVLLIIGLFFLFVWNLRGKQKLEYLPERIEITTGTRPQVAIDCINSVNKKNDKIRNIIYENIELCVAEKIVVRVRGFLAFEKDKKLRLVTSSFSGKEIDIGSNDDYFWFWSRRMKPPALYYASQGNITNTRLKTPFHPVWLMETLSIGKVDLLETNIVRQGKYWAVTQPRTSILGSSIIKITMIDPEKLTIVGHYIYESGRLVVSTEIIDFYPIQNYWFPKKVRTIWLEEGVRVDWSLGPPQINKTINSNLWKKPQMQIELDMAK
jgi:hypothetical protein